MLSPFREPTKTEVRNKSWYNPLPDEEIEWVGHPSFLPHIPPTLLFIGVILIGFGSLFISIPGAGLVPFALLTTIGAGGILFEILKVTRKYYIITNIRTIKKMGIIRHRSVPVRYNNIEHVEHTRGYLEQLLQIGDVQIATAGTGGVEMYLDNVRDPKYVARLIDEHLNETINKFTSNNESGPNTP